MAKPPNPLTPDKRTVGEDTHYLYRIARIDTLATSEPSQRVAILKVSIMSINVWFDSNGLPWHLVRTMHPDDDVSRTYLAVNQPAFTNGMPGYPVNVVPRKKDLTNLYFGDTAYRTAARVDGMYPG